jgi:hypothetical protein
VSQIERGVVISKGLADFEEVTVDDDLILGEGNQGELTDRIRGILTLLPGAPQVMLQNREAYVGAEIEFIQLLARTNPFMVVSSRSDNVKQLKAIPSRTVILIETTDAAEAAAVTAKLETATRSFGIRPLEIKSVAEQDKHLSKDMFVSLGLENIRIYLIGGIAVALAGILAISIANFWQMRWTLALVRVRGGTPEQLLRIILSDFFVPIVFGMAIGVSVGVATGYGLTNQMFKVPRFLTTLEVLPVHLILSRSAFAIAFALAMFFFLTAFAFSFIMFRQTARESLRE